MNQPTPLRLAIAQLRMQWTGDGNTKAIVDALRLAATADAQLCVFPELAVTGFHRQFRSQAQAERVRTWMSAIQDACAEHSIAASVGVPTFGDDGRIANSNVLVDESGRWVGVVEKNGLTPAEETFFTRGKGRPVHRLLGRRCTAVLCREVADLAEVSSQLPPGSTDLIFWPGAMRPAVDGSSSDPEAHVKDGQAMTLRTGAFMIQANWPNSLNYPEESAFAGQSVVISPAGEVLTRLPVAEAGVAVFSLGEPGYLWQRQDATTP